MFANAADLWHKIQNVGVIDPLGVCFLACGETEGGRRYSG
jgi:hypothetical protein